MKNRASIAIFLGGMIIGLALAPLTNKTPRDAILSPISPTLAQTSKYLSPLADGVVLGVSDEQPPVIKEQEEVIASQSATVSQFATLIEPNSHEADKAEVDKTNEPNLPNETNLPKSPTSESKSSASNYSGTITIAAVGDSLTDLMGPDLPYLKKVLKAYYPQAQFNFFNYGVGAQNIEKVADRLTREYDYQGRHYQMLSSINPDLVILESCAYNPFMEEGDYLNRHWSGMAKTVDLIKGQTKAKIMILATIAPAKEKFGQGPAGVNWPPDLSWQHAERINQYLNNAVNFAHSAGLPLVDVYHQSLLANGEGNPNYINPGDHIHQNVAGDEFISQLLAPKIYNILGY
jgi:hypothetical protein